MAHLIQLVRGEKPPMDADWILITKLPAGSFEVTSQRRHNGQPAAFGHRLAFHLDLQEVLRLAATEAEKLGIPSIYRHFNTLD